MRRALLCMIIAMLPLAWLLSQEKGISGRITDQRTRRPLAFVNIVYNRSGQGTVSDIDGRFSIPVGTEIETLKFSYLGYHPLTIPLNEIPSEGTLNISLEEQTYEIREVEILPGVNPAHRIIRLAGRNRKLNDPEQMQSFSYNAYSKMYFTFDMDSVTRASARADSARHAGTALPDSTAGSPGELEEMEDFLEKQHLFLMEFVSHREFMQPGRNRETVTASRVSGFSDPSFTLLASQIQSFSFYDDLFNIWDKKYLNPISPGSTRKYLFILEDTLYTHARDSLFVISYRPLKNRNFDGLKGVIHINSRGYAVQNVIAEAAETEGMFRIRIQQKYELVDNRQWFPVQLNTDLILSPGTTTIDDMPVTLIGIGKSYIMDIQLDPELSRREFDHVELIVEDAAHKRDPAYWDTFRVAPLTAKDSATYVFIDSIGEEADLDRSLRVIETVASGYIPVSFLNVDARSILHWNSYEGLRFGLAAETNRKISAWFSLGGKVAYGTRDRQVKYGGHLRIHLNRRADAFLEVLYSHDVDETAGVDFLEEPPITSSEFFRSFMIAEKDMVDEREASILVPLAGYVKIRGYVNRATRQGSGEYRYLAEEENGTMEIDRFELMTAGIRMRFAFRESFMETPGGSRISLGTPYPVIQANLCFGIPSLGGRYEFTRMEARVDKKFLFRSLGETSISLSAGMVESDVPYPLLYTGQGGYGRFTVEAENSFATMRLNEFVADRFAGIHLRHDFGSLFYKGDKFQPGIAIAASAGYGNLTEPGLHRDLPASGYEKGYYETGILFNNLLRQAFLGYGLGVFYRLGPYTLPETIENFAFRLTLRINL